MANYTNIDTSGLFRVPKVEKVEDITKEILSEYLAYDPITGVFTLLQSHSPVYRHKLPYEIPVVDGQYQKVMILNRRWQTHKLAVLFMTGKMPDGLVDHINGVITDNRWSNLRILTSGENVRNQKQTKTTTQSGVTGVHKRGKKYFAHIRINKKLHNLGLYDTLEEAVAVRTEALRTFLSENKLDIETAQCLNT
jgi:hypothetical protein